MKKHGFIAAVLFHQNFIWSWVLFFNSATGTLPSSRHSEPTTPDMYEPDSPPSFSKYCCHYINGISILSTTNEASEKTVLLSFCIFSISPRQAEEEDSFVVWQIVKRHATPKEGFSCTCHSSHDDRKPERLVTHAWLQEHYLDVCALICISVGQLLCPGPTVFSHRFLHES